MDTKEFSTQEFYRSTFEGTKVMRTESLQDNAFFFGTYYKPDKSTWTFYMTVLSKTNLCIARQFPVRPFCATKRVSISDTGLDEESLGTAIAQVLNELDELPDLSDKETMDLLIFHPQRTEEMQELTEFLSTAEKTNSIVENTNSQLPPGTGIMSMR
jgi:hypothetical protein